MQKSEIENQKSKIRNSAMTRKESIRTTMRARRAALTPLHIQQASTRIQRAVMKLPEWAAARRVCVYLALPTEAQTWALLAACWKTGKQVWVPAYRKKVLRYTLARLRPDDPVAAGHWAVPEPTHPRWAVPARVDLVVTPGLAFDRTGDRLGHGRGHYDRLLAGAALQKAFKVGLALECQMVARVPMNARDIRLDAVVTERAVYRRQKTDDRRRPAHHSARAAVGRRTLLRPSASEDKRRKNVE
jgi:5-formyltetrahydrofolate cyclo-ligase